MNTEINRSKPYVSSHSTRTIFLQPKELLNSTRAFCKELSPVLHAFGLTTFETWKNYWIASHGALGRTKKIAPNLLKDVLGPSAENDPYQLIFVVETSLVFLAKAFYDASTQTWLPDNAASRIFNWWHGHSSPALEALACTLKQQIMDACPDELLDLLATDPFRVIYHALIPKAMRHTLGAYLSPPELCRYIIDHQAAYEIFTHPQKTLIEPNCGLGAFFSALLAEGLAMQESGRCSQTSLEHAFRDRVFGIENNLGSYVTVRYLHAAICGLLGSTELKREQILWADSVFVDETFIAQKLGTSPPDSPRIFLIGLMKIQSAAKPIETSTFIEQSDTVAHFNGQTWQDLPQHHEFDVTKTPEVHVLQRFAIDEAIRLEQLGCFDFVVGNPPWINWEHLDPEYKKLIRPSWPPLGLFSKAGRDRAFSKEDLSVLATYTACLRFGRNKTKVGLLLPQALFQSRNNAKGFRRFQLGATGLYLQTEGVTDFSHYAAFGDAKNRTAAFFCTLSPEPTRYPVSYRRFMPETGTQGFSGTYQQSWAMPSKEEDDTSNWAIFDDFEEIHYARKNDRPYRARTGVFTGGANAVYYVRILDQSNQLALVENDIDRARIKVKQQRFWAESAFLYPFAKGRDLRPWHVDRPANQGILVPHTPKTCIKPVSPVNLLLQAPQILSYLAQHREMLQTRASFTAQDRALACKGYYTLLRVGAYTFAPYKVAWRYISKNFCCAVIKPSDLFGHPRTTILQEKLISIACTEATEAYFLCAYLSAPHVTREIERRIVGTQISVHVIEDIFIPSFDASNPVHLSMAALCQEGHESDGLTENRLLILSKLVKNLTCL